jgi:Cu(I)/Ag(I) efflux system membrane fusion protein
MSSDPSSATSRSPAWALVAAGVLAGAVAGSALTWLARRSPTDAGGGAATVAKPARKYSCPMHPTIVLDHPGECPLCGMQLVPVQDGAAPPGGPAAIDGLATVGIDPRRQQLIGLRLAAVERGEVGGELRTFGRVTVDETRVRRINVKVGGFVDKVFADFVGKPVRAGDPLLSLFSPELVSAQSEYLLALQTQRALAAAGGGGSAGDDLVASSRRRLTLWDVGDADLAELERGGAPKKLLTLRSPVSGVVTQKSVVEGASLEAGATPYELTDLSVVWVLADVYETELARVKVGDAATLRLEAFPGREFGGRVLFIDPLLDPRTRTARARLAFANPGAELKPELFGQVTIRSARREALRIPADAVVPTGVHSVVFVSLGDGKFQPREIQVGQRDGETVEVLTGLSAGESVVVRANFLVDSESRLRASLATLGTPGP